MRSSISMLYGLLVATALGSPVPEILEKREEPALDKRQTAVTIFSCSNPGQIALTFDDGPVSNTYTLLDTLAAYGAKATFFVNGQNFGSIYDNADAVRRMDAEGHQVGSHT